MYIYLLINEKKNVMTVTTVSETKTKSTLNAAVRTSDVITYPLATVGFLFGHSERECECLCVCSVACWLFSLVRFFCILHYNASSLSLMLCSFFTPFLLFYFLLVYAFLLSWTIWWNKKARINLYTKYRPNKKERELLTVKKQKCSHTHTKFLTIERPRVERMCLSCAVCEFIPFRFCMKFICVCNISNELTGWKKNAHADF